MNWRVNKPVDPGALYWYIIILLHVSVVGIGADNITKVKRKKRKKVFTEKKYNYENVRIDFSGVEELLLMHAYS